MQAVTRKKPAMERPRYSHHITRNFLTFVTNNLRLQAFEEGIEIVSRKIIQVNLKFQCLAIQFP
ncbi:hypothetical protein QW71_36315, partial [Paenibacillus sp. IHB B 3415]